MVAPEQIDAADMRNIYETKNLNRSVLTEGNAKSTAWRAMVLHMTEVLSGWLLASGIEVVEAAHIIRRAETPKARDSLAEECHR